MNLYLNGEVGYEIVLKTIEQNWNDEITDVYINSLGGDVYEGLAIYNFLKSKEITTHTNGVVASIASVIFLAGKKRIVNQFDDFLIHCPIGGMNWGNADEFEKQAVELRKIENKLASIYEIETNMSFDEALEQMRKEDFVNPEWLLEKGFANEIFKIKAVATIKQQEMNLSETDKNWFETMFTKFSNILKSTKNIILQDANGVELDFYELEPDAEPKVGDKAKANGETAEGDFVMPNGDTYTFVGGVLETITPKADETNEEVAKLQEEVARLTSELQAKSDAVALKETEVMALKKEKEHFQNEFSNFKAKLKEDFGYDGKVEPIQQNKTRILK